MYISECYLLLGSNLGDKKKNIDCAKSLIESTLGKIKKMSIILETEPIGFQSKNDFMNQLILIEVNKSPMDTLIICQEIEKKIGRSEKSFDRNYKDREIDIDILKFNDIAYKSKKLEIPHIENMKNRPFVIDLFYNLSQ